MAAAVFLAPLRRRTFRAGLFISAAFRRILFASVLYRRPSFRRPLFRRRPPRFPGLGRAAAGRLAAAAAFRWWPRHRWSETRFSDLKKVSSTQTKNRFESKRSQPWLQNTLGQANKKTNHTWKQWDKMMRQEFAQNQIKFSQKSCPRDSLYSFLASFYTLPFNKHS